MKYKGVLIMFFVGLVGSLGAMAVSEKEAADQVLQAIQELPPEVQSQILAERVNQVLLAPFPTKNQLEFAKNFFLYITQLPRDIKKQYLNKFAKQWYLQYGKWLKIPANWIQRQFPGQTPEQVLDYGFSIAELLKAERIPNIKREYEVSILSLANMRINNLNGLLQIPDINTVHRLRLTNNQLSTLEADSFAGLANLWELNLNNNQLNTLAADIFKDLDNLTLLSLNYNQLSTLAADIFKGLGNLKVLYLSNNQLKTLAADSFKGLGNLEVLSLSNNQLSTLEADSFKGLGNLTGLYLDDNQLSTLAADSFKGLGNLEELSLSNNQLSTLEADSFKGLGNLRLLSLSNNQLSRLAANSFKGLNNLTGLYLKGNLLSEETKKQLREHFGNKVHF